MRNLNVLLALFIATFFVLTSCQKDAIENTEMANPESNLTTEEGRKVLSLTSAEGIMLQQKIEQNEATNKLNPFTLSMDNGNELQFFPEEDATSNDFFVLETGTCQSCSALGTLKDLGKKEYTAKDIFWAFSKPGTAIPFQFNNQKSLLPESHIGTQGWGLKSMNENRTASQSRNSDIACENKEFRSSIAGGFLDGVTTVRYDKTPLNYSYFTEDCLAPFNDGRCWPGDQRYSYRLRTSDPVRRWAGKVCVRAVEKSYNDHDIYWCGGDCPIDPYCDNDSSTYCEAYFGPEITFERYYKGKWVLIKSGSKTAKSMAPKNKTKWYSWWGSSADPQHYRLQVKNALAYDEFDFMSDKEF